MLARTPSWPPDYRAHIAWRLQMLAKMREDEEMMRGMLLYYSTRPAEFICHWADTYDPRNAGKSGRLTRMPFILFPRQLDFVEFMQDIERVGANGMCEKSRDMGITWIAIWYDVWKFRFVPGSSMGWGSRKSEQVDKLGDMDSIFEKIRWSIRSLPEEFLPPGFSLRDNMAHMKIWCPSTETSITGEGGDDIGRGGRKTSYKVDEASHLEHPESVEASLGDNTNCRLDISSVAEPNNIFHKKRQAGIDWQPGMQLERGRTYVFVADWRDHPAKTLDWYLGREREARDAGLLHVFRSEVDRDYYANVVGQIIDASWIESAIDADIKLGIKMDDGGHMLALDVGDSEDGDRNAGSARKGIKLIELDEWVARDQGVSTRRMVEMARATAGRRYAEIQYDCIGVGAGVKTEANRLAEELDGEGRRLLHNLEFVPWNAALPPLGAKRRMATLPNGEPDAQSPRVGDFYENLKAQGWWELRLRFERTHLMVTREAVYPVDKLICISGKLRLLGKLKQELVQPIKGKTSKLKMRVDKLGQGQRSPNLGDSVMQNYWPVPRSVAAAPEFGVYETTR